MNSTASREAYTKTSSRTRLLAATAIGAGCLLGMTNQASRAKALSPK
jgi:hypothetical protein